ncbi:response regulator transcription factor [Romboutsia sp. 1001216sp1]|uniref:response regulator transcription factor n=1 Tax=Romboutsia sp. 1001216sp1 TaxID=2986997 RepID=UPI00232EE0B7|nr:response regulator transcription factor [Romboutsia sp. 1001216sp1]MDB8804728.1 response regulator transcription factor [Romboutsia sp. 1001216sp1]MDB8806348.1 response regulator transcription factor [Romboutsia sp. 1001216sp1]MDB8810374.1 response regulator transcription factor [Romboutsia sp. 1001216sp1]MDB8817532.1 response regulator transcription factor [Romboutsia sp. 1001216sp1]MDB8818571.1 response regulator transcription factor [Romboutsia sp. 1001216sp1]
MNILIISESFILKEALSTLFKEKFKNINIKKEKDVKNLSKDIGMYGMAIIDIREKCNFDLNIISNIKENNKRIKVIIYNLYKDEEICIKSIRNGADAYITDIEDKEDFGYIINKIMSGGNFYDPFVVQKAMNKKEFNCNNDITIRENEVIDEIAKGLSNREIASRLGVTEYTVKKHITNILYKLNLRNRQDIIIYINNLS